MRGIGDKELAGRSGIAFEVEEYAIYLRLRVAVFAFGYRAGKRRIAVHEFKCIIGQFAQIMLHGLVGAMNRSIQRGVIDIDPIGFVCAGLHLGILREREGIWVS